MIRVILSLVVLCLPMILSGCAGRSTVVLEPQFAGVGATERVFVTTTRGIENGQFTHDRRETLDYLRFDVSVPPDREAGAVEPADIPPDPNREFLVTEATRLVGTSAFQNALAAEIASRPADEREVIVFIHGYNTTFADGLYRTAQIRHDFDLSGVPVHFAWASAANPLGYAYDRESALLARDGLETALSEIAAIPGANIVLVAHSLGAGLTMEVLRQMRIGDRQDIFDRISGVILLSPDVDIDVFRSQAQRIDPLPQPFLVFTSQRDRALLLSALITGQTNRLGTLGQADDVAEFDVTLIDVSGFRGGENDLLNHFTVASSPAMVELLQQVARVNLSLGRDPAQQLDLLQGTVLTVRNATQVILAPNVP